MTLSDVGADQARSWRRILLAFGHAKASVAKRLRASRFLDSFRVADESPPVKEDMVMLGKLSLWDPVNSRTLFD